MLLARARDGRQRRRKRRGGLRQTESAARENDDRPNERTKEGTKGLKRSFHARSASARTHTCSLSLPPSPSCKGISHQSRLAVTSYLWFPMSRSDFSSQSHKYGDGGKFNYQSARLSKRTSSATLHFSAKL